MLLATSRLRAARLLLYRLLSIVSSVCAWASLETAKGNRSRPKTRCGMDVPHLAEKVGPNDH